MLEDGPNNINHCSLNLSLSSWTCTAAGIEASFFYTNPTHLKKETEIQVLFLKGSPEDKSY